MEGVDGVMQVLMKLQADLALGGLAGYEQGTGR
jgi:hypothetical protein